MIQAARPFSFASESGRGAGSVASEAVRVTVPQLVGLSRPATQLSLSPKAITARQGGDYLSPFKGRGMEFDEARLYQPGDDIRNIDWRVTARTGKAHTKLFREERERPVLLWVDYRPPMFFATRGRYKAVTAARAASLLAWSANRHGDRVGAQVFSTEVHHESKPQRGKTGVLSLIHLLVEHPAWDRPETPVAGQDSLRHAVARLGRVARPGSLVFLISDFRGLDRSASMQLIRIARHSEIVLLMIYDPLERWLPPPGRYRISDGEREVILDSRDRRFAEEYAARFDGRLARLRELARRYRMFVLPCVTDGDLLSILKEGLLQRPR